MDVDGISVEAALAIKNASIASGYISEGTGHLILVSVGGTEIDAGNVIPETDSFIVGATIDSSGHLIVSFADGSTADAGKATGRQVVEFSTLGTTNFVKASYPGMSRARFFIWGGGGGGGGGKANSDGGGGGGGGCLEIEVPVEKLPASMAMVIGAGGAGGAVASAVGSAGAASTIDIYGDGSKLIGGGGGGGGNVHATSAVTPYTGGHGGKATLDRVPAVGGNASATANGADGANAEVYNGAGNGANGYAGVPGQMVPGLSVNGGIGGYSSNTGSSVGSWPGGGGAGGGHATYAPVAAAAGSKGGIRVIIYYD